MTQADLQAKLCVDLPAVLREPFERLAAVWGIGFGAIFGVRVKESESGIRDGRTAAGRAIARGRKHKVSILIPGSLIVVVLSGILK